MGGYTQAIARKGFFYLFQGYYNMGRRITFTFIKLGYWSCLFMCLAVYLFNIIFNIFPQGMFMIIALYFFFLTSIWLSVTVMYILRKELAFTGLIILGIFIVYILFYFTPLNIIISQLIAIFIISVIGMFLVYYYFKKEEAKEDKGIAPQLPRMSITIYSILPYFLYGFLYFFFLFLDRINAWSANEAFMPYFIWFRGEYELGLDFALLVLIIPLGTSEVLVHKLMIDLQASQKKFFGNETNLLNIHFKKVYYRILLIIIASSLISSFFIYELVFYANDWYYGFSSKYLIAEKSFENTTYFVFIVAMIAYNVLAIALMNVVILFSLSQAELVNRCILPAVAVNMIVGFLCSRWFDYETAVFGLLAGTVVFLVLSVKGMLKVLNKLDYYIYAGL